MIILQNPVEVNLWSYKGKITSISWRMKLEPWHPEDQITVWIDLDKPIDGTSGFGISLPVKDYDRREFLASVIQEGEKELKEILARNKVEREEQLKRKARERELDASAQNIVNQLSSEG